MKQETLNAVTALKLVRDRLESAYYCTTTVKADHEVEAQRRKEAEELLRRDADKRLNLEQLLVASILVRRDEIEWEAAIELVQETIDEGLDSLESGDHDGLVDVLENNLGLEPDYIMHLWM